MTKPYVGCGADFNTCVVRIHDDHIETQFKEDGSVSRFYPPSSEDFKRGSSLAGYGDDLWRFGVEHELCHGFLADVMGWPHSWSVWSDAHRLYKPGAEWSPRVRGEEHTVIGLQRYMNTGKTNEGYHTLIDDFGEMLDDVCEDFICLLATTEAQTKVMDWIKDKP